MKDLGLSYTFIISKTENDVETEEEERSSRSVVQWLFGGGGIQS